MRLRGGRAGWRFSRSGLHIGTGDEILSRLTVLLLLLLLLLSLDEKESVVWMGRFYMQTVRFRHPRTLAGTLLEMGKEVRYRLCAGLMATAARERNSAVSTSGDRPRLIAGCSM